MTFCAFVPAQELFDKQRNLAGRFGQLEQILLRLAETSESSNPRQASLLRQVLLESKDRLLAQRMETLVNALERRQFSDALTGQTNVEQDMLLLLQLLESLNRDTNRDKEKEAVKEFIEKIEEILHRERVLRAQTNQLETEQLPLLEKDQRNIRIQTQTLQERMAEHEGETLHVSEPSSPTSSESKQDGNPSGENKQGDNESQQGEPIESSEQSGQEESPSPPPSHQQSQNQQAMQRTLEQMKQAEQRLQEANKEESIKAQEEAIAELQRLKEELEKILRQLREEELMQTLENLQERFKRMLRQEQGIRSQAERLRNDSQGESTDRRQITIRADRLGMEQQSVLDDADASLLILREDGTAQAMAESLLQTRFDMVDARDRLQRTLLDANTLLIIDSVIDSLQEMLEAVQTALEESKQRQESAQGQQQESGGAQESPLIQLLAELRMIQSMQRRVNERTQRYDEEIKRVLSASETHLPPTDLSSFRRAVEELARQQNKISRILHELRIGKTQ